jgi:hypothetical protein
MILLRRWEKSTTIRKRWWAKPRNNRLAQWETEEAPYAPLLSARSQVACGWEKLS